MSRFALLIILLTGCSTSIGDSQKGTTDARPIQFRETPTPKEGTRTAPGCDGITAFGECKEGKAVRCDLEVGRKRTVDCAKLSQDCTKDISKGVICQSLDEDTGPGSGAASECTDSGISESGYCTEEGIAVYCDTSGSEAATRTWDCSEYGLRCAVDEPGCHTGASCCGDAPVEVVDCGSVTFRGTCAGDVASWCDPTLGLQEVTCGDTNKSCEEDTCATGAYCCEPTTSLNECLTIGNAGICKDADTVRYCAGTEDSEIMEFDCDAGETCQVDGDSGTANCETS